MKISILTLFPQMFDGFLTNSIIKRAITKETVEIRTIDIRDYTKDRYHRVDTPPVGGGAGLIMKAQPIIDAIKDIKNNDTHIVLLSPRGNKYSQKTAKKLAKCQDLVLICGHYEGIDERVNSYVNEEISIGDFILTGGEIAAMAIADSVIRLQEGAIASESLDEESFENGMLEYPQYTEPYVFEGSKVPDILYSGNHTAINKWRRKQSLVLTRKYRPDLFAKLQLSKNDFKLLQEVDENIQPDWEKKALEKGAKFIKK
ncbi:MAG: tRNA (guanosine(37)-N1)-methyltransferase TrmD [Bacilli bacterium]|jgi:tRNA (guanine37-N1)-methyltransferase|nr:tRNA (guanosine(37)-N1)-methyltransferase TrmD [Bacilli bacterium]